MILHIATNNTFTKPFFGFVKKHFGLKGHVVLSRARRNEWAEDLQLNEYHGLWFGWVVTFFRLARKADRIILHNLNDPRIVFVLLLQPWVLSKCYWLIWGSDLYAYRFGNRNWKWHLKELVRRPVIKRIGHLVSYVPGDADLARKWYAAKGQYQQCLMYTSNLMQKYNVTSLPHETVNILVGNSGDPSNNHLEIFDKLKRFKNENIRIYVPMSYGGNELYRSKVREIGNGIFYNKLLPLTEFMPLDEYLSFLAQVDIAIFNHRRQQAMGNTINLLGMGKTIYMRSDVTLWDLFASLGLKTFDVSKIDLNQIDNESSVRNKEIVRNTFSEAKMANQYRTIFE